MKRNLSATLLYCLGFGVIYHFAKCKIFSFEFFMIILAVFLIELGTMIRDN